MTVGFRGRSGVYLRFNNRRHLMTTIFTFTVSSYLEEMTSSVGTLPLYQDNLLSEMAGFAGCELIRRYTCVYTKM